METKRFHLRVLLTVTTGRLLTKSDQPNDNGIGDMYDLLGWMTNDTPFTHQLGRFADECKPWLLRWFPKLAELDADVDAMCEAKYDSPQIAEDFFESAMIGFAAKIGQSEFDVPRIPRDDHEVKHPFDELVAMRGTDEGIAIVEIV